jgi:hypothetical protein
MLFSSGRPEHALIAIYGDNAEQAISRAISLYLPDRDIRILTPTDKETLEQAARNSVLVFVGIHGPDDPSLLLGRSLQDNRLVVADVIGFYTGESPIEPMQILGKGFDGFVRIQDTKALEFKRFLATKIARGARRLDGLIQEEEYRRLSDALSVAPVSMIIFDADKRAVFVSDHYFRAYPKIAPRLIRGLRVYDAFEMMAKEEGLTSDDARYEEIRQFWHNLDGGVEFTLDDGITYKLKAIQLPSNRGTIIIGQNITGLKKTGHD